MPNFVLMGLKHWSHTKEISKELCVCTTTVCIKVQQYHPEQINPRSSITTMQLNKGKSGYIRSNVVKIRDQL